MSDSLHVQKQHDVQYADSGWFHGSYGAEQFHNVLNALNVEYTTKTDFPEYEWDFKVRRYSLADAVETLQKLDEDEVDEEELDDVDLECLCEALDDANMTLSELVDCFIFLLTKSDQNHNYIYVSFF